MYVCMYVCSHTTLLNEQSQAPKAGMMVDTAHQPLAGHAIETRPSAYNVESLVSLDNEGYCPRN